MSYKTNFVGLVCFLRQEDGGRLALLPNGTAPELIVDAHFPQVIVAADALQGGTGWEGDVQLINGRLHFDLPPCSIELEGADEELALDTTQHDGRIPALTAFAPDFRIDPTSANAVAQVPITRGKLGAFRRPGSVDDDPNVAIVSQLEVPHDGPITITIRPVDQNARNRRIKLRAGTEVVIANVSRPSNEPLPAGAQSHFRIYEQLATDRTAVDLSGAVVSSLNFPVLQTSHPAFSTPGIIGTSGDCGNTGCCRTQGGGGGG